MASGDRPPRVLTPEEVLAERLAAPRGSLPPEDLEGLAREFAELEVDRIPADCDAVVVGLHGERPKPLIVLNRGRPKRRQRFSLAHEIGHIVIPWHIGTIACHTAYDISGFGDYYYRLGEAEANRFAATLLLPAPWVREQIETHSDVRGALGALWETGVSAPAACLRLIQFLSPNTLFVLTDLEGCVEIADVSPGSSVKAPARGTPLRRGALDPVSSERYTVQLGGRRSRWWVFNERVELEELEDDTASSASLLDSLLTRHFKPAERAAKRNRIAGIIGYANGKAGDADAIQLHGVLRGAFAARDDLEGLVQDPDFATFLSLRAGELRE